MRAYKQEGRTEPSGARGKSAPLRARRSARLPGGHGTREGSCESICRSTRRDPRASSARLRNIVAPPLSRANRRVRGRSDVHGLSYSHPRPCNPGVRARGRRDRAGYHSAGRRPREPRPTRSRTTGTHSHRGKGHRPGGNVPGGSPPLPAAAHVPRLSEGPHGAADEHRREKRAASSLALASPDTGRLPPPGRPVVSPGSHRAPRSHEPRSAFPARALPAVLPEPITAEARKRKEPRAAPARFPPTITVAEQRKLIHVHTSENSPASRAS